MEQQKSKKVYLDHAATTYVRKEVIEAMLSFFTDDFGNPSSIHSFGRNAKAAVNEARRAVAGLINADEKEIVFTSSGTEANNLAIVGLAGINPRCHLITTSIEHPSVLEVYKKLEKEGHQVTYLSVDQYGMINLNELENAINGDTAIVSIMFANNEIGTIQPIKEIADIIERNKKKYNKNIYFHTDAVQAAGSLEIDIKKLKCDLLSFSSHKLYGPKGVGALFVKKEIKIQPQILGGGQENNRRSSTENVAGIVGFAKACQLAKNEMESSSARLTNLREYLKSELQKNIPELIWNGHPEKRLPNNLNVSVKYIEGEAMLLYMDRAGIAVSTGSACSAASLEPSHVLLAIGLPHEIAHGSIRFSLGLKNTKEELDYVVQHFTEIVNRLRNISSLCRTGG